jgi:hypothetical protein
MITTLEKDLQQQPPDDQGPDPNERGPDQ